MRALFLALLCLPSALACSPWIPPPQQLQAQQALNDLKRPQPVPCPAKTVHVTYTCSAYRASLARVTQLDLASRDADPTRTVQRQRHTVRIEDYTGTVVTWRATAGGVIREEATPRRALSELFEALETSFDRMVRLYVMDREAFKRRPQHCSAYGLRDTDQYRFERCHVRLRDNSYGTGVQPEIVLSLSWIRDPRARTHTPLFFGMNVQPCGGGSYGWRESPSAP